MNSMAPQIHFSVISIFPELVDSFRDNGVVGRACRAGLIQLDAVNLRDYATGKRANVDDEPYGGGPGMVMMVEPLRKAIAHARGSTGGGSHVIHVSPQGRKFTHQAVAELSQHEHLIFIAGRYEGIDERLIERDVDSEWSIGDFVVSGGELPALMMIDAIARFVPGVLGDERSPQEDSFCDGLLDHPHFTRPPEVDGAHVPEELLTGNHQIIAQWRRQQRLLRTLQRRPELLESANLSDSDRAFLAEQPGGFDEER